MVDVSTPVQSASLPAPAVIVADVAGAVASVATVAEAGNTTSEWQATIGAVVVNLIALAADFGFKLDPTQTGTVEGFAGLVTAAVIGYAVSRGIRKKGTTA